VNVARRALALFAIVCVATALLVGTASAAEKVPVGKWMSGVCETLTSWRDDVQKEASDFSSSVSSDSSVSEVKDEFVSFIDDALASTKSMLSDLRGLGVPDVRQGSGIAATIRTGLTKIQKGLEDARRRAENLPTNNPTKFKSELTAISSSLDKSSAAAGKVFDAAKKKYDTKALDAAQKKAAACKGFS
jgi:hypothetical protein